MKAIMRAATVLGMAGLLLGCATAEQRELQGMAANNRTAVQGFQACVASIYNQPELEPLRKDLPLDISSANIAQLANQNFVSDVEVRLILANHPKLQACRKQLVDQLSQTAPTVAPIMVRMTTANDNHLIGLLQKRFRWGEFLQRVRDTTNEGNAAVIAEYRQMLAALQQSHEAELERRRAAIQASGDAMQRYGETQQAIYNANRSVLCTTQTIMPGYSSMTSCH
jgi:hypothetical protein